MKKALLIIFAILAFTPAWAGKKKGVKHGGALPASIRNFPSGTIDEYHFRPGDVVVRGCVKRTAHGKIGSLLFSGRNLFTNDPFAENVAVDSTGHFCSTIRIPHSQFLFVDRYARAFAAVGDTLDITIDEQMGDGNALIADGTGATGEVNRLWPTLRRQFISGKIKRRPWTGMDRQVMLDWKKEQLEELRTVALAVDADTIALLSGCSPFAKDVLKSSLLACIPEQIGEAFNLYKSHASDEYGYISPEKRIAETEIWDFLTPAESYLLDNPCILLAADAVYLVNQLEFGPLQDYLYPADELMPECDDSEPDYMALYKIHFALPATYDRESHRRMLACRQDTLMSVADYYRMATDSIHGRFGFRNNFMMQVCLMHCALCDREELAGEGYAHQVLERFAASTSLIDNKLVAYHGTDAYSRFIAQQAARTQVASLSPEGDAIFDRLIEKYRGNILVIDFWGISCGPCRAGMLEQREDVEYFRGQPVRFLYICNEKDSPREQAEDFLQKNNICGEHIFVTADEWNHLSQKFQFVGIPFHVVVDKYGNITKMSPGRYIIEKLLKE